jgi:tryptophan synthase alpha chain
MTQNRIDQKFEELRMSGKKALILFIQAGDPSLAVTRQTLRYCEEAGVDCVEIGIPFSDPLADGPVIQAASYRALRRKTRWKQIVDMVKKERRAGLKIPVVFMTSFNPLHAHGLKQSAAQMRASGVDGVIVPDLPLGESAEESRFLKKAGIHQIYMATPTTQASRMRRIAKASGGFLYYVSLVGLTGTVKRGTFEFKSSVLALRKSTKTPVCVGFGVSEPKQAKKIAQFADGVIVGSALVEHLKRYSSRGLSGKTKKFISSFVRAVKS